MVSFLPLHQPTTRSSCGAKKKEAFHETPPDEVMYETFQQASEYVLKNVELIQSQSP